MTTENIDAKPRKLSVMLIVGLVLLPIVFCWFTLRKGYSMAVRIAAFVWLVVWIGIMGMAGEAPDPATTVAAENAVKTPEQIAAELQETYRRRPAEALELEVIRGEKGGFETVLILSGRITNAADFAIKDMRIRCDLFAASGTRVGDVRQTLFDIVPANGDKRFDELNMGFMGSAQVDRYTCTIIQADAA